MTKDKTVTMSRELAQKLDDLLYIMTGHDSYQRLVYEYGANWWNPINEMRAEICTLLAAPVVESQEPVAVLMLGEVFHGTNGPEVDDWDINWNREAVEKLAVEHPGKHFELFTSPPAPVAVVPSLWYIRVPDEPEDPESPCEYFYAHSTFQRYLLLKKKGAEVAVEYACIDKVKELNK